MFGRITQLHTAEYGVNRPCTALSACLSIYISSEVVNARFEVLAVVLIKITAFRVMMPSRLVHRYRRIERARHLHVFKEHDVVDLNACCHVPVIFTVGFFEKVCI